MSLSDSTNYFAKADATNDRLGKSLDSGIYEAVIAFWVEGFETCGSCEGHKNWGKAYPWVDFIVTDTALLSSYVTDHLPNWEIITDHVADHSFARLIPSEARKIDMKITQRTLELAKPEALKFHKDDTLTKDEQDQQYRKYMKNLEIYANSQLRGEMWSLHPQWLAEIQEFASAVLASHGLPQRSVS